MHIENKEISKARKAIVQVRHSEALTKAIEENK